MILALQILAALFMFAGVHLSIGLIHAWVWMDRVVVADRAEVMAVVLGWPTHLPRHARGLIRALTCALGRAGQRLAWAVWGRWG